LFPSATLSWMKRIDWSYPEVDEIIDNKSFYEFAGLWDELQPQKLESIQNEFGVDAVAQARNSWPDILRFIGSGQKENVLRILERRHPQQEISILPADVAGKCNHKIDVTVWFTPREHRGSTSELGLPTTFVSAELGQHRVMNQLIQEDGLPLSFVSSSYNSSNTQKHEHSRTILIRGSGQPTLMLYRWSVRIENSQQELDMVKWYQKSPVPTHPGRFKILPLPTGFMTKTSDLFAYTPKSKVDSGFMMANTVAPSKSTAASVKAESPDTLDQKRSSVTGSTTRTVPMVKVSTFLENDVPPFTHTHVVHPLARFQPSALSRNIHQRTAKRPHKAHELHQRLKRKNEAHIDRAMERIRQNKASRGAAASEYQHIHYNYKPLSHIS